MLFQVEVLVASAIELHAESCPVSTVSMFNLSPSPSLQECHLYLAQQFLVAWFY